MRIRSALLVACMVVVPMIAMFSHRVPASLRTAVREAVWNRLVAAVSPARQSVGQLTDDRPPDATPSPPTVAASTPPTGSPTPLGASPLGSPPVTAAAPATASPAAVPPPAGPASPPSDAACRDAETRLAALGAMAVECHPLPGGVHHAASCRVAIDATGQLHRLFQASGSRPADAMRGLVADVSAWRQRLASRAGDARHSRAEPPTPARTMNF